MKIVSWNINGIRSVNKKGVLKEMIDKHKPDIVCLQELKCSDDVCPAELETAYKDKFPYIYYNTSKTKKGYSGTAILSSIKPSSVVYDLVEHDNDEGRVLTAMFKDFILITVYTPNSGAELKRLDYRINNWDADFQRYIGALSERFKQLPLVVCGDLNVAHNNIDIYNHRIKAAGFMPEERSNFDSMLNHVNLIDTFRHTHPKTIKYSYWSALGRSRPKNNGWRIDYFLISKKFQEKIRNADILVEIMGSDHAPVYLELDL